MLFKIYRLMLQSSLLAEGGHFPLQTPLHPCLELNFHSVCGKARKRSLTQVVDSSVNYSPHEKQSIGKVSISSVAQLCLILYDPMDCSSQTSLSITNSGSLLKLMSIELVMPSYDLILCRPLLLLPSIFPRIRIFLNESVLCIRWPKYYWSFNFSISHSSEYSGLISFKIDWFDLLVVQGTLLSLLQHHG